MGNDQTEDRMTGTEAIDYLGLQDACREWLKRDENLSIIEFACDRGHYLDCWDDLPVEYATAQATGLEGYEDYEGDLDDDLQLVANGAVEYLTTAGLLPNGYGYRPELVGDGYGLDTDDEEGS